MRDALVRAYRRLPESVRYGLRPVNGVEEAASFLPSAPRLALLEMVRAYRSLAGAARRRAELALLDGVSRVDGAALRVATDLAGDAVAYWTGLLFEGVPTRRVVGEVRGPLSFARMALPDADLTLLRLNRVARGRAQARGFLVVPAWVQTTLDTRRSLEAIAEGQRLGRSSRKNDIRRAQKAGFRATLASGPAEVHHFFEEWCLPFTQTRFGATAVPMGKDWVRQVARFCDVVWIEREGVRVGGALIEARGRALRALAFGLRDPSAIRDGVLSASYWLIVEHAVREGFHTLQLGSSRPVLSDGPLRYKFKWGGVLTPARQWDYFAVGVARNNAPTRAILAAHPLIMEDGRRFLAVTTGATSDINLGVGLSGLLIPTQGGWTARSPAATDAA